MPRKTGLLFVLRNQGGRKMRILQGNFTGRELKIGIVAARFNEFITSKLISGAEDALVRHEVKGENIDLAWVPGAFEIPLVAKKWQNLENMMLKDLWAGYKRIYTTPFDYACSEYQKVANVSLTV